VVTSRIVAIDADALAFVYSLLNGGHPRSLGRENS
jgi:hypothetical protein